MEVMLGMAHIGTDFFVQHQLGPWLMGRFVAAPLLDLEGDGFGCWEELR